MNKPNKTTPWSLIKRIIHPGASRQGITEKDLRNALLEGEKSGLVESKERAMVEGVFYLGDRPVRAFMTHRSDIAWLDIDAAADEAREAAEKAENQLCFPVVNGDLDDVAGMVFVRDIYKALLVTPWPGLKTVMRSPSFIPETMSALKAFEAFKRSDANDLFVMDEYGGFAGILSVRDLIEEIVGELSPEGVEGESIVKQGDGSWLADGGASIDDTAKALELESLGASQSEYHTLAGFIFDLAGEIPKAGSHFDYKNCRFIISKLDGNRIDKIVIFKINS